MFAWGNGETFCGPLNVCAGWGTRQRQNVLWPAECLRSHPSQKFAMDGAPGTGLSCRGKGRKQIPIGDDNKKATAVAIVWVADFCRVGGVCDTGAYDSSSFVQSKVFGCRCVLFSRSCAGFVAGEVCCRAGHCASTQHRSGARDAVGFGGGFVSGWAACGV